MGNAHLTVLKFPHFHFLEECMSEACCLPESLLPCSLCRRNGSKLPGLAMRHESSTFTPLTQQRCQGPVPPPTAPLLGQALVWAHCNSPRSLGSGSERQGRSKNLSALSLVHVESPFCEKHGGFCAFSHQRTIFQQEIPTTTSWGASSTAWQFVLFNQHCSSLTWSTVCYLGHQNVRSS